MTQMRQEKGMEWKGRMEASKRKMDRFMKGLERGPKDGWIGEVGVKGEWNGGGVRIGV